MAMSLKGISVILPTYNERENVENLVHAILEIPAFHGFQLEVIIVDDNSPDGTGEIADRLAKEFLSVKVVHRPAKMGLGSAIKVGSNFASYDRVVVMDADFSHPPSELPKLVSKLDQADIVVGSRYVKNGRMNAPYYRVLASKFINYCIRWLAGLKVRDCTGGFHAMRKRVLEELDVRGRGGEYDIELLIKAQRKGYSILEVPFVYGYRTHGASKTKARYGITYLLTALKLRFSS
jgi:dolichol-phosphate mannosyltransferase